MHTLTCPCAGAVPPRAGRCPGALLGFHYLADSLVHCFVAGMRLCRLRVAGAVVSAGGCVSWRIGAGPLRSRRQCGWAGGAAQPPSAGATGGATWPFRDVNNARPPASPVPLPPPGSRFCFHFHLSALSCSDLLWSTLLPPCWDDLRSTLAYDGCTPLARRRHRPGPCSRSPQRRPLLPHAVEFARLRSRPPSARVPRQSQVPPGPPPPIEGPPFPAQSRPSEAAEPDLGWPQPLLPSSGSLGPRPAFVIFFFTCWTAASEGDPVSRLAPTAPA